MAKFRKDGGHELPEISTSSLPDIIFMLLFFFMATTSMKEVTYMVNIRVPEATELSKLEKKSLVKYVYVGKPLSNLVSQYGSETRLQLDDAFADVSQLEEFIIQERSSMKESDQSKMIVSIKADKGTKMGIITDVKQSLRKAYALKINYAASERQKSY
jgi:biopolymer transport protein ExbD